MKFKETYVGSRYTSVSGVDSNGNRQEFLQKRNACLIYVGNFYQVLLVRVWRPALGLHSLELPGGRIEDGLSPKASAQAELFEETGIKDVPIASVGSFFPLPSICNEECFIFSCHVDELNSINPQVGSDLDQEVLGHEVVATEAILRGELQMLSGIDYAAIALVVSQHYSATLKAPIDRL